MLKGLKYVEVMKNNVLNALMVPLKLQNNQFDKFGLILD